MAKRARKRSYEDEPTALPQFNPVSIEQEEAYDACCDNDITFLTGPAGGGKTWVAVAYAIDRLLNKEIDKILLTRPAIEACGESMGYGPGTFQQKLAPYTHPMRDVINEYGKRHLDFINSSLEMVPLAFMRGRTMKRTIAIVDEAQNASEKMLQMMLTRIGEGSQIILCGDPVQRDIRESVLESLAFELSDEVPGVGWVKFTQANGSARHPIIPKLNKVFLQRLERE